MNFVHELTTPDKAEDHEYVIDLTNGYLTKDISNWLSDDPAIAGFYGDYYDVDGNYVIQQSYPSKIKLYPGLIVRGEHFGSSIDDLARTKILRYIPEAIFRITK